MELARERAIPKIGRMTVESPTAEIDGELLATIRTAAQIQRDLLAFEKGLKALKMSIADQVRKYLDDEGTVTIAVDGMTVHVRVGFDYAIPNESIPALRQKLGEEYYHFMRERVSVVPTQELIALACDGDKGLEIRRHMTIRPLPPEVTIIGEGAAR